jgi:hypothetical protein
MRLSAVAAPRCPRHVGLATVILFALCSSGFAASQALARGVSSPLVGTETTPTSTTTTTTSPPTPDPLPLPKPDPSPSRPKRARVKPPPPPPPPPPAARRREDQRAAPRTTVELARVPAPPRPRLAPERREPAAAPPRRPPPPDAAPKARREDPKARRESPPIRRTKRVAGEPIRVSSTVAAPATLDFAAPPPAPRMGHSEASFSSTVPVVLALFVLGLALLGASAVEARRIPWPALAEPLSAHRVDVAAVGLGAIAFAVLWLNVAVVF